MDRSVSRPLRKRRVQPHRGWVKWLWSHPTYRSKEASTRSVSACVLRYDVRVRYDVLDFLAVLGYAVSGERTDGARSTKPYIPLRSPTCALFGRASRPSASTLSRFLAALPAELVEALRTFFLEDLLARRLSTEEQDAGLWDRQGNRWLVFDVDGTREAARQRARPADRRIDLLPRGACAPLCAPGYTGRETCEKLFGHARRSYRCISIGGWPALATLAMDSIAKICAGRRPPSRRTLQPTAFRLRAHCSALMANMALERSFPMWPTRAYVTRGKDYKLLDRADVQARLHLRGSIST
jgi:hypothetical protein